MIEQMAIAIAFPKLTCKALGRSVTPTFLFMDHFFTDCLRF